MFLYISQDQGGIFCRRRRPAPFCLFLLNEEDHHVHPNTLLAQQTLWFFWRYQTSWICWMFSVEYFGAGQTAVSVAATKASAGGAWNAQWPPADLSSAFSEDRGPKVKRIDVHVKSFYFRPIFDLRGPSRWDQRIYTKCFQITFSHMSCLWIPMVTEAPKDSFGKVRCTKEEPTAKHFLIVRPERIRFSG